MKIELPDTNNVNNCIMRQLDRNPQALCCAVRVNGTWLQYSRRQFKEQVNHYARAFGSLLPQPKMILFIKKLDIHLLTAYIGAMQAGHLPAQISFPSGKVNKSEYAKKIKHIKEITDFGAIFTDAGDSEQTSPSGEHITLSPALLDSPFPDLAGIVPGRDALIQFSSGTTGLQKGVVLTHECIMAHMRNYGAALELCTDDAVVSWLPLYHDMGLIACYLLPLIYGMPFYQMDPFDWIMQPDLLLQTVAQFKPTICYLPNFAFQVLADKGRTRDLASIRLWINCSEPAKKRSHDNFLRRFPSVRPDSLAVCYALAENTFAVSQTPPRKQVLIQRHGEVDVMSCGAVISGVDVKVFWQEGNTDGEIGLKSDFLFDRFTDDTLPLTDGYYLTGDIGFVNDQGELFITGRKKDLIIVNGRNIYPQDVEYAASSAAGVYPGRVVAFGIWSEEIGSEELFALVERKPGVSPTSVKIAVQKAVNEEIGLVPKRVEVVEHMSLVKTSSGKISRRRNKEIYLEKGFTLL